MKTCTNCPSPAACKAAGKCLNKASGMAMGGMAKKKKPDMLGAGMYGGGMAKKRKGYNKGGYCGASNPAERPMKTSK